MTTKLSLLWHDDELIDTRKDYVAPWSSWLDREAAGLGVTVTRTSTLQALASELQHRQPLFDLLLVDVMLKREPETTFASLGFPNERLLRLDAGVQLVGLMRNAAFDAKRQAWLAAYRHAAVILLSSSPTLEDLIKQYVDADRMANLWGVSKSIDVSAGEARVDRVFDATMRDVIARQRAGPAASTTPSSQALP